MRTILDRVYVAAERLAMAALAAIALMVFAQVMGRIADVIMVALGWPPYGFLVPSLAEFAGFLLVAASFLALAGSFRAGTHIRVTLAIGNLPDRFRRFVELAVLAGGTFLAVYFTYYAVLLAVDSYRFDEVSFGIIAMPLWIPQGLMALGVGVFALALIDDLVAALKGHTPSYLQHEAQEPVREEV